jgi:plastocyanin
MTPGFLSVALLGASLFALFLPAPVEQATGSVAGVVTLTASRSAPLATSVYGRRGVAPKPAAAGSETRKVVVYLHGVTPRTAPAATRSTIVQKGEQFDPAVTAVTVGSTIEFPNQDPFFHNVFSLSRSATFDLGRYPAGDSKSWQFTRPGIVKVFCQLHSHMNALIVVLNHPWFTIPADSGAFSIAEIPVGEHTIVAWHERIGERRERVRVTPGGTTTLSFALPVLESRP